MSKPRLLALSGSARRDSLNRKVLAVMARGAEVAGAEVRVVSLGDYPLPLYDGDLEDGQGLPDNAARLQQLFADHDGLLLASPEYNGFFTPLLKNALDWVSRPLPDGSGRPGTVHVRGKPAGITAASPGGLGGIRSLQHTRQYLANLGFLVVPEQMGVSQADKAFTDAGELRDEGVRKAVEGVGAAVARLAMAVRGG
ncbi:FMN reductase [Ectothiorhodospira shaposhnikovii]|uniref:NADPH-dependent FMN reductase n=1 Tax=Ectothiorhodospira shaposhnikovii TaxID=1054 RepID=UPI00190488EC|nr:NAD(P)H-dependent oxidoreductase [Ectothiorhodospira shaposhnikovii]MBK1673419.1 FMN reductase [Ectothiorhodospira shaposhnikovii]